MFAGGGGKPLTHLTFTPLSPGKLKTVQNPGILTILSEF